MIGTLLNAGTVVVGTVVGRLLGGRLPVRMQETQMAVVGLLTLVLGTQNAFAVFAAGHPPREFLAVLLSLLVGCWVGEALRLSDRIEQSAAWAERRFGATVTEVTEDKTAESGSSPFVRALVTTSLLFCVGPLTILGAFDDGLRHDIAKLTVKSVLDGVSAAAYSAALGWGVLLSAGTILIFQGALTLGAGLLRPYLPDNAIAVMTGAGGVMLVGLALNVLGVTQTRIAALLPAIVLAPLFLRSLEALGV
ncbi:MAG: DUF554 domain-containing protein [Cytophagales bacterium]|nr:DUF554 domain-containing protein [Armatimonadota bacterium]